MDYHRRPWTEQDRKSLLRMVQAGVTQADMARRLGRSKRAVRWRVSDDRAKHATMAAPDGRKFPGTYAC